MKNVKWVLAMVGMVGFGLCRAEERSFWPFVEGSPEENVVSILRHRLFSDKVFTALPKGVRLFLDPSAEAEDGWLFVSLRENHEPGSGYDPDVSPAIEHFRIRVSDGKIEWMDVVKGPGFEPYSKFLESRK